METQNKETYDGFTISKNSAIVTDTNIYEIDLLPDLTEFKGEFDEGTAYIDNDFFYIYRGVTKVTKHMELKPGIYKRANPKDGESMYFIVEPITDEQKSEFNAFEHVATLSTTSIIDTANTKEDLLVAIPESAKIFQPTLSVSDDMLKRISKLILLNKNVDLDKYKDRFSNKNELFNYKQVMKGDNRFSILIFNRGCDALNMKYTIIVEEKDPNNCIGEPLKEPIIVSSEDTYDI